MAQIAFPNVSMASINCELVWPGQRIHESVYTGTIQTIARGIGRWRGNFSFPELGRADNEDDIRAIDAFFANVEGGVNTFDLPWAAVGPRQLDAFAEGTDARLMSLTQTGSTMEVMLNQATGLLAGHRITIDNRLFTLVTDLSAGRCTLSPYRPLAVPADGLPINWRTPTVRARLTQGAPVSVNRNFDWAGPWAAAFEDLL